MDYKTLEEKITRRANEQAQADIDAFRRAMAVAVQNLLHGAGNRMISGDGPSHLEWGIPLHPDKHKDDIYCLRALTSEKPKVDWPAAIWHKRREAVRDQILSTMDSMEKMLAAKPASQDDCTPALIPKKDSA